MPSGTYCLRQFIRRYSTITQGICQYVFSLFHVNLHFFVQILLLTLFMMCNSFISVFVWILFFPFLYKNAGIVSTKSKRIAQRICNVLMNALTLCIIQIDLAFCLTKTYCWMNVSIFDRFYTCNKFNRSGRAK